MNKLTSLYRPNVGVMIINKQGKVLICQRSDIKAENMPWQMVQGGIDDGETLLEAAYRELREETNIHSEEVKIVEIWDEFQYYDFPFKDVTPYNEYIGQKQKWVIVNYLKDNNSIDLNKAEDDEFNDYKWVDMAKAVELIWQPKKAIYKRLAKRYSKLLAK